MHNNKKGLSDLVSNVLIILLVFASIAIMGVIILNLVKISGESIENSVVCKQVKVKPVGCIHNVTDANLLFATEYDTGIVLKEVRTVAVFSDGTSVDQSILGAVLGNFETQSIRESRGDNNYDKFYTVTQFVDKDGVGRTCVSDSISCTLYRPTNVEIVPEVSNPASCGTAVGNYRHSATDFIGTFCDSVAPIPLSPRFPEEGQTTTWTCEGETCTARKLKESQSTGGNDLPDSTVGSCGTPTKAYTCQSGSVLNQGQTTTHYTWTCSGSGEGDSSGTCSYPIAPSDYDYSIQTVSNLDVPVGGSGQAAISISSTETAHQAVTLTAGTLPIEISLQDSVSKSCTPTLAGSSASCTITFNFLASSSSIPGTYTIPITATTANTPNKAHPITAFIRSSSTPNEDCPTYSGNGNGGACVSAGCTYIPENSECLAGPVSITCTQLGLVIANNQELCTRFGCGYTGGRCTGGNLLNFDTQPTFAECASVANSFPNVAYYGGQCYDGTLSASITTTSPIEGQSFVEDTQLTVDVVYAGFNPSATSCRRSVNILGNPTPISIENRLCSYFSTTAGNKVIISNPGSYFITTETIGFSQPAYSRVGVTITDDGFLDNTPYNPD